MKEREKKPSIVGNNIISDMVLSKGKGGEVPGGLIVEPDADNFKASFPQELGKTLESTEHELRELQGIRTFADPQKSWQTARHLVERFQPVPWFIWRLCNFVLSKPGTVVEISEGLVFGLRRLLFAAASDEILGAGRKVNTSREALSILSSDVVAACAVIHAVCRRLSSAPHERIWRPILDDAMLRARLGFEIVKRNKDFSSGRGMLAGFAGRMGLAVQISSGDLDQARVALERLATGAPVSEIGLQLYGCEPLQVSAMVLSAAGCGRDAAFGVVSFASDNPLNAVGTEFQLQWLAAFSVTEMIRTGRGEEVSDQMWAVLRYADKKDRSTLQDDAKKIIRRGHSWNWLEG